MKHCRRRSRSTILHLPMKKYERLKFGEAAKHGDGGSMTSNQPGFPSFFQDHTLKKDLVL